MLRQLLRLRHVSQTLKKFLKESIIDKEIVDKLAVADPKVRLRRGSVAR